MNNRNALVRWTGLLAALVLVLSACVQPAGTPTPTAGTDLPGLEPAAIMTFLQSKQPMVSAVQKPKFILTPLVPSAPSVSDIDTFSYNWAGSPVPYPVNQLTLYTQDCSQPVNVDSFSVDVKTKKATSFKRLWMVMTYVNNVQNNLFVGPATATTFGSASTQTFAQDTPFSLTCGTYIVALAVDFGTTGGYLMESLVIQGMGTATPAIPSSSDVGDISSHQFFWAGNPVTNPANQLTLFTPNCSQPVNVDSFSVKVTTGKATTFEHGWMVMTYENNVQNNLAVGPGSVSSFASASTQTIAQDTPFSLTCGTYIVALWVNFGSTGGYLMESLVIQGMGTATPVVLAGSDVGDITGHSFNWAGNPVSDPANQLTLYSQDCNQPITVDSFSVKVTTGKATSFEHGWMVMTYENNVQNNLAVGPGTLSSFASASTQTFQQDTPFSLTCGTYIVALWVNFGSTGGYLMESLVIAPASSATLVPTGTTTPSPTPVTPIGQLPQLVLTLNANCHRGPGQAYDVVTYGMKGDSYPILGMSPDYLWYLVRFSDRVSCWMSSSAGEGQGSLTGVPVIEPTSTPVSAGGVSCSAYTTIDTCGEHISTCRWEDVVPGRCVNR